MGTSKKIETWTDYDRAGHWQLHIKKTRGKLTLDEITEAAMTYDEDFYMLVIKAMSGCMDQYYETDDLDGDYVTLYRAGDFFNWREKD